jgi:hypothetical protein
MTWTYTFDSAESMGDAKNVLTNRSAQGWEAISFCRCRGPIEILFRRQGRATDRRGSIFESSLDEEYGD